MSFFKDPRRNTKLWWIVKRHCYGGSFCYRKVKRPFDSGKLVHAVFKARLGQGIWFTRRSVSMSRLLKTVAKGYGVKIKDFAFNRDHIHVLFWCKNPEQQALFLRLFAASVARKYKSVFASFGLKKPKDFWIARPFTRLVSWGKNSLEKILDYIQQNRLEALGFVPYKPRKHKISEFLTGWRKLYPNTA